MFLLTSDNCLTKKMFGAVYWAGMPPAEWDIWPVLDTTSVGIETPTKALRMQYQGY